MYSPLAAPHTAGLGGASLLATGFDTLAAVVAATTLLMACVSVAKLLPRRSPAFATGDATVNHR